MASPAAASKLRELQSLPGNKICVDCSQKNPQWASVSLGVFMCLECSGKHRGLGVHISFVRSVTMDSWSDLQLKKMEVGGNNALNDFFRKYDIPKETDIPVKYNSKAAEVYRSRIQALAEGRPWTAPPIEKTPLPRASNASNSRTNASPGAFGSSDNWDDWGDASSNLSPGVRRNSSQQNLPSKSNHNFGPRAASAGELYTRTQLEASAARKDAFFAQRQAENASRPEGIPPSQGGKYVGFGSSSSRPPPKSALPDDVLGDTMRVMSQGFNKLSVVASNAAQSATHVVQSGTREIQAMVKDGGYDQKAMQTATAVVAKTTELGNRTWGLVRGIAALATKTVENALDPKDSSLYNNQSSRNPYDEYSLYESADTSDGEHFFRNQNPSRNSGENLMADTSKYNSYNSSSNGSMNRQYESKVKGGNSLLVKDDWDDWGNDNFQSPPYVKSFDTPAAPLSQANNSAAFSGLKSNRNVGMHDSNSKQQQNPRKEVDLLSGGDDWAGWDVDEDRTNVAASPAPKSSKDNDWDDWGFK